MYSSTEIEAIIYQERKSSWEKRAAEMVKRCDPTHPEAITKKMFLNVINLSLSNRDFLLLPDNHYSDLEDLKKLIASGYVTVFDVLTVCLTRMRGSHGPHSFKFGIVTHLFGLSKTEANQSSLIIECFINALHDVKDDALERKNCLEKIISRMKTLTPTEFLAICQAAREAKEHFNEKTTEMIADLMGTFTGIYTKAKDLKKSARDQSLDTIEESVRNGTLSVFDALTACLTLNIGKTSAHSFKHFLIKVICGDSFNIEEKVFIVSKSEESRYLARLCEIELSELDKTIETFIDDLIHHMKASHEKDLDGIVKRCITLCTTETLMKSKFIYALEQAIKEKTDKPESENPSLLSKFTVYLTAPKTMIRNKILQALVEKLKSPTVKMSAVDALHEFLTSQIGQEGPHSLKYALLKKLFPELNQDSATCHSKIVIDCFIHVIQEARKDAREEKELKPMLYSSTS